ncbi:hypothetical protein ScPMuIL_008769 [Solemya velum]
MAFNNVTADSYNHTEALSTTTMQMAPDSWVPVPITETRDLFWVVPTVIGITVFLVTTAWVLFNMIRASELTIIRMCAKHFSCCQHQDSRDVYRQLKDSETEAFFLKDIPKESAET